MDERFAWTPERIEAVLRLRFQDETIRKAIAEAQGQAAKRRGWEQLADAVATATNVKLTEHKLRRVISKWQSQHRAWNATGGAGAKDQRNDRPPTYLPILNKYFDQSPSQHQTSTASKTPESSSPSSSEPVALADGDENERRTPSITNGAKRAQQSASSNNCPGSANGGGLVSTNDPPHVIPCETVLSFDVECQPGSPVVIPSKKRTRVEPIQALSVDYDLQLDGFNRLWENPPQVSQLNQGISGTLRQIDKDTLLRQLVGLQQQQVELHKRHIHERLMLQRRQVDEEMTLQQQRMKLIESVVIDSRNIESAGCV